MLNHYFLKKNLIFLSHKGKGIEIILPLAKEFQICQFHIVGGTKEQINKAKLSASKNIFFTAI